MTGPSSLAARAIVAASSSARLKEAVTRAPVTRSVVERFVAGEAEDDGVRAARSLAGSGLRVSLDHLGEFTSDPEVIRAATAATVSMLRRLAAEGLAPACEVSVKLTALGLDVGRSVALDNAYAVVAAAREAGTTVTCDMEDSTRTDRTLDVVRELRAEEPSVGVVLQAMLRRTESDARDLAHAGSRVRLCKGAYAEPESVAFPSRAEVDASYARSLGILMRGQGYPMVATHDPRFVDLGERLVKEHGRGADTYEFQMLYGIRPGEQLALAGRGHTVRVYVPYGKDWYGYLMRRLAERPANVAFFVRALATRS
ncbi:proline dehydrogenase family protein [Motilibacter aurantiacus]|uniref:proline dehydrogenase family protein n=1 Tax=Motilibacter aurantiacus TaxID=2714955 RepID=UPI00140B2EE8|nr:proline dehydrogenase family protein [Motilibacter aurantiacus]NHC47528.1 proline dehydrogenase [Motilibacter aurantiacus]